MILACQKVSNQKHKCARAEECTLHSLGESLWVSSEVEDSTVPFPTVQESPGQDFNVPVASKTGFLHTTAAPSFLA